MAREALGLDPRGRVLLVVGGSQGSLALNEAVLGLVRSLESGELQRPDDLQLLWATGPMHLEEINTSLSGLGSSGWVRTLGYIHDMPLAIRASSLAVSRAGASTTSEFLASGLPSILVPLPTSAADHQARNAESLERAGAAVHLPEHRLSPDLLWETAREILEDEARRSGMRQAALERGRPEATREIAGALAELLPDFREVRS
jgi:UDP-N-acetylglucosamine--N-acetylmuramyl-(pentapeptide) pyrophosphoryl-undecaprenol N-acetylglucosamine transferase